MPPTKKRGRATPPRGRRPQGKRQAKTGHVPIPGVELVELDSLIPAKLNDQVYNPVREDDPATIATANGLRATIDRFGIGAIDPIVITLDNVIVSGHRRRAALRVLGETHAPVRRLDLHSTDPDFPEFLVRYNDQRDKDPAVRVREQLVLTDPDEAYRERERAKIANPVHVALRRWVGRLEVLPDAPAGCPALDHIAAGDCWFSVCGQGRVHSPATNLDRKYRPFVRLAGRELVSVDVSAAQPLLLAAALAEPSPVFPGPGREDRHAPRGSEGRARKAKPIVVQDSSGGANDDGFFRDARTGVLYDRLAAVWRISRDEAKLAYMVLVYGFPRRFNRDRQREFADLYPATWAKLASLALGEPDGEVARMVQRAESGLMIGRVAARFMREFRTAPVLTCHDALLVPPEFAPAAETIIGNEWERVYGYRPRVKSSPWT